MVAQGCKLTSSDHQELVLSRRGWRLSTARRRATISPKQESNLHAMYVRFQRQIGACLLCNAEGGDHISHYLCCPVVVDLIQDNFQPPPRDPSVQRRSLLLSDALLAAQITEPVLVLDAMHEAVRHKRSRYFYRRVQFRSVFELVCACAYASTALTQISSMLGTMTCQYCRIANHNWNQLSAIQSGQR